MSVAFRRESDEEHLEPKFELPIPPGPNLVTPRGMDLLRAKVSALEAAVTATTDEAELASSKRALRYWKTRAATALPVNPPLDGSVGIGSHVSFRLNGTTRAITIVGGDEAEPASGALAFTAPLARAMMEAEAGDLLDFAGTPEAIEILAVDNQLGSALSPVDAPAT